MDSFAEYLSNLNKESSFENADYYKIIIIQKIVRMFHTLKVLTNESVDEVSVRCVLRGILDSIATYSFIYQREDKDEIMFRHYLYVLDGVVSYYQCVTKNIMGKEIANNSFESLCNEIIRQLQKKLASHPYSNQKCKNVKNIINNANWRYETLNNTQSVNYLTMYRRLGFDDNMAKYYQCYLSHFSHGLSLSNMLLKDSNQMKRVLFESIPLAERFIHSICNTFPYEKMLHNALDSRPVLEIFNGSDFNYENLSNYAKALINQDRTLLI